MTETRGLASVENIGIIERFLRVFHAPRRTFGAIIDGGSWPDWVAPVAIAALFWATHNLAALPVVAPDTPTAIQGWDGLTEEQQQMAVNGLAVWRSHGWFSMPLVTSFSSLAIVGLILVGICKWILRAQITLRQTLAVKAYASLVMIPQWILLTPLVRAGNASASPLTFTPGALLEDPSASMLGRLLEAINLFDIWEAVVIGIGLSVMTAQPARRTIGVIVIMWLAWTALGALAPTGQPPAVS